MPEDAMHKALRGLGETMGFTGRALDVFVHGREGTGRSTVEDRIYQSMRGLG